MRSLNRRCIGVSAAVLVGLLGLAGPAPAQEAGGSVYGRRSRPETPATGQLTGVEPKDSTLVHNIEATVLMNVRAQAYQAVLGLQQEGPTVAEANRRLDAVLRQLQAALAGLGLRPSDIFVDFVTQNRVYDLGVAARGPSDTLQEKLSGFEVKKNVIIRYGDRALLDRILATAARLGVFDLVKVDHLIGDPGPIRERLLVEASRIVQRKQASYARLLGIKLQPVAVSVESYRVHGPSELYSSYQAYEAGHASGYNTRVIQRRKVTTFYYSPLPATDFDQVIQPMGVEPLVQCTLHLRIRHVRTP